MRIKFLIKHYNIGLLSGLTGIRRKNQQIESDVRAKIVFLNGKYK